MNTIFRNRYTGGKTMKKNKKKMVKTKVKMVGDRKGDVLEIAQGTTKV